MYRVSNVTQYAAKNEANVAFAGVPKIGDVVRSAGVRSPIIRSTKLAGDSISAAAPKLTYVELRVGSTAVKQLPDAFCYRYTKCGRVLKQYQSRFNGFSLPAVRKLKQCFLLLDGAMPPTFCLREASELPARGSTISKGAREHVPFDEMLVEGVSHADRSAHS